MARASKPTPPPDDDVVVEETLPEPVDDNTEDAEIVLEHVEDVPTVDEATGEVVDDEPIQATEVVNHPVLSGTGLSALPTSSDPREWNDEQKALLDAAGLVQRKNGQVIPAPRATIAAFLTHCHRTGLDPIARQIYCIERGGKWTIQISIDGFRLIAERSRQYRGQTPVQWTADGKDWVDVWLGNGPPAAARVGVWREGFAEPLYAVARFSSYDASTNLWKKMPEVMIAKVAEMLALRKAFPMELSGLYGTEEMEQADARTTPPRQIAAPATLRDVHRQGVDEHKVIEPAEGDDGDTATGQRHPATPEAAAEQGAATWQLWKDRIDSANTLLQLTQVRQEMDRAGLLQLPVPGSDSTVAEYFVQRRTLLSTKGRTAATTRLQDGLKQDNVA